MRRRDRRARGLPRRGTVRVELRRRGAAVPAATRSSVWRGARAPGWQTANAGEGRPRPRLAHGNARRRARAGATVPDCSPDAPIMTLRVERAAASPHDRGAADRVSLLQHLPAASPPLPLVSPHSSPPPSRSLRLPSADVVISIEPRRGEGGARPRRRLSPELRVHADALRVGARGAVLPAREVPVAAVEPRARDVCQTPRLGRADE